ncbi:hypothetical protein TWF694_001141 [Orbilia ellipsospora]|uniref:Heterokaryon incompatibility domain-containing protein n=1 Tax=Orbilia ellipsospora TaxID=2528407 RepID=A0AAV9XSL3_9PEZI
MEPIEDLPGSTPTGKPKDSYGSEILNAFQEHEQAAYLDSLEEALVRGSEEPPMPGLLPWDLNDSLLDEGQATEDCANFIKRENLRLSTSATSWYCNNLAPLPNRVAQLCYGAKIRACNNKNCLKARFNLDKTVPESQWTRFRDWAITLIACQSCSTHEQKLTKLHTHLVMAVFILHYLLISYREEGSESTRPAEDYLLGDNQEKQKVELFGVYEILYWMLSVQSHLGIPIFLDGKWSINFVPKIVVETATKVARERARYAGICQHRLTKLFDATERKEGDLPGFMLAVCKYPRLSHCKVAPGDPDFDPDLYHANCTPQICLPNKADTTRKAQLHKCCPSERASCENVQYRVDDLEESIKRKGVSAWSIYGRHLATVDDKFVAISHVWIDGTGIGNGPDPTNRKNMGLVNQCLDKFWRIIVERLGCTAFWWDTISLPTSPTVRRKEINEMHWKYSAATHIVVHDSYLLDFDWSDDGSPCIALVLSSWFTRGWTSLELHAAKSVKILYKGSDPMNPTIKDLDEDILAAGPTYATSAYWVASSIIRRLRRPVKTTSDMLSILVPRETCRREDRTTIAGLLAGLEPTDCPECLEISIPETRSKVMRHIDEHTSRRVLIKCRQLSRASLMHGKETMAKFGPWSWAPREIHDIPVDSERKDAALEGFTSGYMNDDLTVYEDGTIVGGMDCRPLKKEDAEWNIIPADLTNDVLTSKVRDALIDWETCVILREPLAGDRGALLATVVGYTKMRVESELNEVHVIECRYIGAIAMRKDKVHFDVDRDEYAYDGLAFRFGNDRGESGINAKQLIKNVKMLEGYFSFNLNGPGDREGGYKDEDDGVEANENSNFIDDNVGEERGKKGDMVEEIGKDEGADHDTDKDEVLLPSTEVDEYYDTEDEKEFWRVRTKRILRNAGRKRLVRREKNR